MDTVASDMLMQTVEPFGEPTRKLLRPTPMHPDDRLQVSLTDDGDWFRLRSLSVHGGASSYAAAAAWHFSVPGRRQDKHSQAWEIPATDTSALITQANWPDDSKITFTPEAELTYRYLIARFMADTERSLQRARYKLDGTVPSVPEDWLDNAIRPAAPYQFVGAYTSLDAEAFGNTSEMGTGKTLMTMLKVMNRAKRKMDAAILKGRPDEGMYKFIIFCPKNLRINWAKELEAFCTLPGKITVLRGGALSRLKLMVDAVRPEGEECYWSAAIMSYDSIPSSKDHVKMIDWDLGIADESHNFKGPRTRRAKMMLNEVRDACSERIFLTGTPVANRLFDLWTQLEWLGRGVSGFLTFEAFRAFYGKWVGKGKSKTLEGYDHLPLLQERLARFTYRVTKKEALPDLPSKRYSMREVSMTPRQAEMYTKLQSQLRLEIEALDSTNAAMTVNNVLTMLLRLAQITSGFLAFDAEVLPDGEVTTNRRIEFFQRNPKLDELISLLKDRRENSPLSKTIVWACFVPDINEISRRLTEEGFKHTTYMGNTSETNRQRAEHLFNNDPEYTIFLGNPSCCKEGLNLRGYNPEGTTVTAEIITYITSIGQSAGELKLGQSTVLDTNCDMVVYYSQDWSMPKRLQSEDRAHRRGTRVGVEVVDLVVPDSIDEEIRSRVVGKAISAIEAQDLKAIMTSVLGREVEIETEDTDTEEDDDDE